MVICNNIGAHKAVPLPKHPSINDDFSVAVWMESPDLINFLSSIFYNISPVRSYTIKADLHTSNKEVQERVAEISPVKRPLVKYLLNIVTDTQIR